MMKTETPKDSLRLMARAAIVAARGDTDKALERLDAAITKANDAAIERELTSAYRTTALRALLATHYNELRAEGQIKPRPEQTRVRTTDYDQTTQRPSTWASRHVAKIEEREQRRYLDHFMVGGEPIGDCTAEVVLARADSHERDARFMRLVASGVPPQGVIRNYVTEDEAAQRWEMAQQAPSPPVKLSDLFATPTEPNLARMWKWLFNGIKNDADLKIATERAAELMDAEPGTQDGFELDGLARAIHEYENR